MPTPPGDVTHDPKPTNTIDPRALAAFQREMASRGVDLSLYEISYYETPDEIQVVTFYKHGSSSRRGSDPVHKDYDVRISKTDFTVKKVYIAR